jgi:predicted DNA binding CopG/RHH family protein
MDQSASKTRIDARSGEKRVLELGAHQRRPNMKGDAMKKESSRRLEAEDAFARQLYRDRAPPGTRQITIRLSHSEIALARQQAEAKGLKYQTCIKMLLHEALAARTA